jgi:hypothetical protein
VYALLKLLMTGGAVAGALRAKLHAVRRSAGAIAALTFAALIATSVGVASLAVAGFFALRPSMADYQAALVVAAILIVLAAIAALVAVAKVKRVVGARSGAASATAASLPSLSLPDAQPARQGDDPLVRLLSASVQSPVVMSALVLGILAGRATKRSRRD